MFYFFIHTHQMHRIVHNNKVQQRETEKPRGACLLTLNEITHIYKCGLPTYLYIHVAVLPCVCSFVFHD